MSRSPFSLHTSKLNAENCPVDPIAPVPSPWDRPAAAGAGSSSTDRVYEIGQAIAKYGRSPALRPYEELFRSEPNDAWFDPSRDPDRPTQFEIASVRPGAGSNIIVMDYSVQPYGFSGTTSLDFAALEDDEISACFGFSLLINGQTPGKLRYRLDPVRSTLAPEANRFNQKALQFQNITEDDFVRSQANSYASAAGVGTALHPQSSRRYGGRIIPFGEFLMENQALTITGVIFRPVEVPLAFVQVRISGFEVSSELGGQIEQALRTSMR